MEQLLKSDKEVNVLTSKDLRKLPRPPEQTVITNYICDRIRRGLGLNCITVGAPGLGKSYTDLRIAELCLKELYGEELENPKAHIVDNVEDAFRFVRRVKRPGMPLIVEEVSVIASSRRSMAADNVSLNALLDTVRKKQIILLMNAPTVHAVDKHIKRMSHLLIECLRVNRKKGFATIKALRLQHNQHSGKVYTHRFKHKGRDIYLSSIHKPSEEVCKLYEEKKDEFLAGLYELSELKSAARRRKLEKQLGHIKGMPKNVEVTQRQYEAWTARQKGNSYIEIAKMMGVSQTAVRNLASRAQKAIDNGAKTPNIGVNNVRGGENGANNDIAKG